MVFNIFSLICRHTGLSTSSGECSPWSESLSPATSESSLSFHRVSELHKSSRTSLICQQTGLPTSSAEYSQWSESPYKRSRSFPQVLELHKSIQTAPNERSTLYPPVLELHKSSRISEVDVRLPFIMPSRKADFWERVYKHNVLLEQAYFSVTKLSVVGDVLVTNLSYEKEVSVLCTWNDWSKQFEVRAEFNAHYGNLNTDVFTFELPICFSYCNTMMFAIRYKVGGKVFWDNNGGENYPIQIKWQLHSW